jgi:hypothetical protein
MKLIIPSDEQLAFGVGTSAKNEYDDLYSLISLKIAGFEVIISKLK